MANLLETIKISSELLNKSVSSFGVAPGSARVGTIIDFTELKHDLTNIDLFVHALSTTRKWIPADNDMTRQARNPLTGEEGFYKAGDFVKLVVLGTEASFADHRTLFNTPNTTVLGEAYSTNGESFAEMMKSMAGKKIKCTAITRHPSDRVVTAKGAFEIPSYTWEAI